MKPWLGWIASTAIAVATGAASAASQSVAQVDEKLAASEAYAIYAKVLVQIDLLANPKTAYLPITVSTLRPGQILLDGRVPTARLREYLIQNARRITGLAVEGSIEVADLKPDPVFDLPVDEIETEVRATISGFYPEYARDIRSTVKQGGIVEINGEVPSYEAKLNISRIVKSQQGCKAVVNLLRVPAEPESGLVHVTEDGQLRLDAARLPVIPAAAALMLADADRPNVGLRGALAGAADDAPVRNHNAARLIEDARAIIGRDSKLAALDLEIDSEAGGVVVSGTVGSRETVEYILDTLAEIPDIKKIVVKSRPISMQRTFPAKAVADTTVEQSWYQKLRPWSGEGDDPIKAAHRWRFRGNLLKVLKAKCEGRVDELAVKAISRGLMIEGSVASARDRAFVFKQIDNLADLNAVPLDVVLHVGE